ncbi:MAG: hypothetical protein RL691_1244 [Actinomycetota bacterium]
MITLHLQCNTFLVILLRVRLVISVQFRPRTMLTSTLCVLRPSTPCRVIAMINQFLLVVLRL